MEPAEQAYESLRSGYLDDPCSWATNSEYLRGEFATDNRVIEMLDLLTNMSDSDLRETLTSEQGYARAVERLSFREADAALVDSSYTNEWDSTEEQAGAYTNEWDSSNERAGVYANDQATADPATDAPTWEPPEVAVAQYVYGTPSVVDEARGLEETKNQRAEDLYQPVEVSSMKDSGVEPAATNGADFTESGGSLNFEEAFNRMTAEDVKQLEDMGLISFVELTD